MNIDDEAFNSLMAKALDELPEEYVKGLKNVFITYEDKPTEEQRRKLQLRGHQTLFGLYEGVPLTQRGAGYNMVLPDRITLFKLPLSSVAADENQLYMQIKHTLWHEIAHYYGLGHDRIHEIERNWQ